MPIPIVDIGPFLIAAGPALYLLWKMWLDKGSLTNKTVEAAKSTVESMDILLKEMRSSLEDTKRQLDELRIEVGELRQELVRERAARRNAEIEVLKLKSDMNNRLNPV